jgi:subtilisin family serine protease
VDDVHGWDFGVGDADPNPQPTFDPSGIDVGFHGTFCAGLAAAATDNVEGIAGAAWHCRLMPLKVSDPAGDISSSAVASAFAYAIDNGVSVLSMSFGSPGDPGVPEFFQALVDDATAAGIVCVAAAGNDGTNVPVYPAANDKVIAVAATNDARTRSSFSNWGTFVDVAAPGEHMWSSICRNYEVDEFSQLIYLFFFEWNGLDPYMYGDGTSFACPLTAGVCGLIRSRYPALTPAQVRDHLVATGDVVAFDEPIGPKVNAANAVQLAPVAVGDAPTPLEFAAASPTPFATTTTLRFALAEPGPARLTLFDCTGRAVRTLIEQSLTAGPHEALWDGTEDSGAAAANGVYFARLDAGGRTLRRALVRLR